MNGYLCNFQPGWDCHGLPIELNVESQLREQQKTLSPLEFRQACREYAQNSIKQQAEFFQQLGILGNWQAPYSTMEPSYEATITRILSQLLRDDALERRVQPVHWCVSCRTALAEFEVEYKTKNSRSIYIGVPLISDPVNIDKSLRSRDVELIVWLNQPWTLTATQALAVHPEDTYTAIRNQKKVYILGLDTKQRVLQACGWNPKKVEELLNISGKELLGLNARHPLIHRKLPVLCSDKITQQKGSGIACTTPGHHPKDYELGKQEGLEIQTFISDNGSMGHQIERWAGLSLQEVTKRLLQELTEYDALLNGSDQNHQSIAPHCWKCTKPVIFRATAQWFLRDGSNRTPPKSNRGQPIKSNGFPKKVKSKCVNFYAIARIGAFLDNVLGVFLSHFFTANAAKLPLEIPSISNNSPISTKKEMELISGSKKMWKSSSPNPIKFSDAVLVETKPSAKKPIPSMSGSIPLYLMKRSCASDLVRMPKQTYTSKARINTKVGFKVLF